MNARDKRTAEQSRAHRRVRDAIKRGALSRPATCERCQKKPAPGSDGRATIHAHHARGYDCPLDVEWLCAACHRKETPMPQHPGGPAFGTRNGAAKLTPELVRKIKTSPLSGVRLAKEIGVNHSTVNRVRAGKHWLTAAQEPTP